MLDTHSVLGYAVPLSVSPGERISFCLSSPNLRSARAGIVKVRCADADPAGPGLRLAPMRSPLDGEVALRHQPIQAGSSALVPDAPVLRGLGAFSFACFLWPTLPGGARQTIVSRQAAGGEGWRLEIDEEGRLAFHVSLGGRSAVARAEKAVLARHWLFVTATYDADSGSVTVGQKSLDRVSGRDRSSQGKALLPGGHRPWPPALPLVFAAQPTEAGSAAHLNGKIDRPRLHHGALTPEQLRLSCSVPQPDHQDRSLVAAWDFSLDIPTDSIRDRGPNRLDGTLRNNPGRAVTGAHWTARTPQWTEAPEEYSAIHFHDDDMDDCRWSPDLDFVVPPEWPTGFYSLRLSAEGPEGPVESHVPFFVGAEPGRPRARLAFVAATATFLAYSNSALRLDVVGAEAMLDSLLVLSGDDAYLQEHRELGLSTYDTHSDGSGWWYASAARPILNMRPRSSGYYTMDTKVLDWLDEIGLEYDVITDDAIHRHGAQLLNGYTCVMTGCHPEYFSAAMLDAFENYQAGGGRHIYLGGNGFYWRTAFHPARPDMIEIRRGLTGTRTWEGEPGENGLACTGEPSGLWRSNGRPPQRLVGVGFDAQVFDRSGSYRRLPDSHDPRAAFVFEGIGADEVIGDFGLRGGAAGHEIDRVEASLGSPPHLLHLATADRIGSGGLPTPEEFGVTHRVLAGDQNAQIRADMAFFPTAEGGAVFTTGSIAWAAALAHNDYRNNVSRITENVVRRFLDPKPFDGF